MARPYRNERAVTCWLIANDFDPNVVFGKYVKMRNDDEQEQAFITHWNAGALGIAQPNQATLDGWEDDCPIVAEETERYLIVTEVTPLALSGDTKTSIWQLDLAASFTITMGQIDMGPERVAFVLANDNNLLIRTVTFGAGFLPAGLVVVGTINRAAVVNFVRINTAQGPKLLQSGVVLTGIAL